MASMDTEVQETDMNELNQHHDTSTKQEAALLDVKAVAAMYAVSIRTVWRMVSMGTLPSPITVAGRLRRWRRSELEKHLAGLK